jgi:hypothetical protein
MNRRAAPSARLRAEVSRSHCIDPSLAGAQRWNMFEGELI